MATFQEIHEAAAARNGGLAAVKEKLPQAKSDTALRTVSDDRYISAMSLRIFSARLKHSMVQAEWPAFEEIFHGFAPRRVYAMAHHMQVGAANTAG